METLHPVIMGARSRRALVALVGASVPPGDQLDVAVDPDDVAEKVGLMMASMAWDGRLAVRIGLWVFDWICVFRYLRPFSSLDEEQQARWVVAWAESGLTLVRLWARMLLTVVKPAHISRRAVHAAIRYPTSRLDGVRPERPVRLPRSQVVERLGADTERRCQVVVVGSGAGGAVMAAELAERGVDAVLVEEGRVHTAEELGHDPSRTIREAYREGATTLALGRPAIPIPLGKTVGGTTTINSGTCFRVPDRVLDRWEKLGLPVDRAHLDQCYSRVEERISVKEVPPELLGGSSHVVARGAEVMGLDHGPLKRNIDGCQRSGVCAFGCPRNGKQSMNITYVPRALEAGATLYTGMRATRVLKKGGRAVGVVASRPDGGPTLTLRADAVVSSCGSISGVSFLKGVGLRSKHLGRHLTIHPAAKIVGWMPEEVNGWDDTPQGYGVYNFAEQGLMFEGAFVPPEYTSIALPFVGRAFTEVMEAFQHLAVFGFMVSDEPSGRVFRAPDGRPVITYWMTRGDLEKVRIGLRILAELFFAAGAERIFLPIAGIEEQPTLDAALAALEARLDPMALELAAFHPLGTARMAAARRDGVVDPDLQSWELPGLYVVDGGVFPTSLGVNPQLTIMCYATRAAQMLAARLGAG